jgi:hypothetical protein
VKGIVFTELAEMVEGIFGMKKLNELIDSVDLESGGSYTSVGTYDSKELNQLVGSLSSMTGTPVDKLVHTYGRYFFDYLKNNYPDFFDEEGAFEFFKTIDSHIHVEVKKLYPDAELPEFEFLEQGENILLLTYKSERKLSNFALGLIERTIEYFDENIEVSKKNLLDDSSIVQFCLEKKQ